MSLYVDLNAQHYEDTNYGVVSNVTGNASCDNYHLFTSEAMLVAGWNIWPQYARFFKDCEVKPGLIKRYPNRVDGGISQDEMIGAATLDENAAKRIYDYGQSHFWYFNPDNTSFTLANWYGRFLDFKPYIKFRAVGSMNIFQQIAWSIMTVLSPMSSSDNTSGKILKWTQFKALKGRYWLCDQAIKFWKWRMKKSYVNGMKSVFTIYFGPNHPITVYSRKDFE